MLAVWWIIHLWLKTQSILQEQQQKQLDLILAIGEASRILDGEQDLLDGDSARSSNASPAPDLENKQVETESEAATGGNNKSWFYLVKWKQDASRIDQRFGYI